MTRSLAAVAALSPIIYRVIFLPWTLDGTSAKALVDRLFD